MLPVHSYHILPQFIYLAYPAFRADSRVSRQSRCHLNKCDNVFKTCATLLHVNATAAAFHTCHTPYCNWQLATVESLTPSPRFPLSGLPLFTWVLITCAGTAATSGLSVCLSVLQQKQNFCQLVVVPHLVVAKCNQLWRWP